MFTLDCVNYGRFSFDGRVFGFIDEFVAIPSYVSRVRSPSWMDRPKTSVEESTVTGGGQQRAHFSWDCCVRVSDLPFDHRSCTSNTTFRSDCMATGILASTSFDLFYVEFLRRREISLSVILVLVCSFADATELPLQLCMSASSWQSLRPPCLRPTSSLQRLKTMRSEVQCG